MIAQSQRQQVTALVREFEMTVEQLVGEFGTNNVSQMVRDRWDRGAARAYRRGLDKGLAGVVGLASTFGGSGPSAFSQIVSDRSYSGSASA